MILQALFGLIGLWVIRITMNLGGAPIKIDKSAVVEYWNDNIILISFLGILLPGFLFVLWNVNLYFSWCGITLLFASFCKTPTLPLRAFNLYVGVIAGLQYTLEMEARMALIVSIALAVTASVLIQLIDFYQKKHAGEIGDEPS